MQTVVLFIKRKGVAQLLLRRLGALEGVAAYLEQDYANADAIVRSRAANAALIEVAEDGEFDMLYCLALCGRLQEETPECKPLLLCPEEDKAGVTRAANARKEGIIEDFVFYDASADYLISKLLSIA